MYSIWICRMIPASGLNTATLLLLTRCRKQLQSSLTWFINSIFFSYKKNHSWSSKGLGLILLLCLFVCFPEGLCTLAGLVYWAHHILATTWLHTRTCLPAVGNCTFRKAWQKVTAAGGYGPPIVQRQLDCTHWINQTLALHDFWTLQNINKQNTDNS